MRHVVRPLAVCFSLAALLPGAASAQPAAAQPAAAAAPGAPTTPPVPPPTPDAAATELANQFSAAIKCDGRKDPLRHFCAVTRVGKDFMWTPGQPTSYLGLSVTLKTGADLKKTLAAPPATAVLQLAPSSGKIAKAAPLPDADRAAMIKFLATEAKEPAPAPAALVQTLRSDVHEGRVPLKQFAENRGYAELSASTPVRLYRADAPSGSVFVTVEPTADGQVVSVFPAQTGIN
ncbi:MAG: hypothetical protein U1A78_10110 [Polyangia bacterium]